MPENKEDATIQVIAERISSLHEDVTDLRNDMRESYKEMSEAIKSLIRLEEKQMNLYSHYEEINGMKLDNELKERTIDNKVKESSLTLQNLMAEILLKGSQRKVNEEQAKAIPAQILQGWEELF